MNLVSVQDNKSFSDVTHGKEEVELEEDSGDLVRYSYERHSDEREAIIE